MTYVRMEIEGDEDEVVRVLRQLGEKVRDATADGAAELIESPVSSDEDVPPATVAQGLMESHGLKPWAKNGWPRSDQPHPAGKLDNETSRADSAE